MRTLQATTMAAIAMILLLCIGGATMKGTTPDKEVAIMLANCQAAFKAGDLEKIMDCYSNDYTDAQGANKDMVRSDLEGMAAQGTLQSITIVELEEGAITVNGDNATVTPIVVDFPMGRITFRFTLKKETDGIWRLVSSDWLPEMVTKKPKVTKGLKESAVLSPDNSVIEEKAPLPEKITYKKPAGDVPAKIQNLLGKWEGDWEGGLNSYFIFEKVTPDSAEMVYGYGTSPLSGINQGGHERYTALLETNSDDSIVKFSVKLRMATITGTVSYNGKTINAVYAGRSKIKMNKTESPDFELPEMVTKKPKVTPGEFTQNQLRTLNTFNKIDDYPLFVMRYNHDYHFDEFLKKGIPINRTGSLDISPNNDKFACTCFASLSNEGNKIFGRNFDWYRHPTLVLFTNPPDAYRSVSIVDIHYYYIDDGVLTNDEKQGLLNAHFRPYDGVNEHGLAVGLMAVPHGEDRNDPKKLTINIPQLLRLMLDYAKDVESALSLMEKYNIIFGTRTIPSHLLIADANGNSAVIEFINGKRYILRNRVPWQVSTNFIISDVTVADRKGACWRYRKASNMLENANGNLSGEDAMNVLKNVAQINTTWSAVYNMTTREIFITLGNNYNKVYGFDLEYK